MRSLAPVALLLALAALLVAGCPCTPPPDKPGAGGSDAGAPR